MSGDELETRIEYGHQTEEIGWVPEYRGAKYATHQRTVHFRVDAPVLIDHWTFADHRHPVEGCQVCAEVARSQLAADASSPVQPTTGRMLDADPDEEPIVFIDDDPVVQPTDEDGDQK
jgi:hypothetical protein